MKKIICIYVLLLMILLITSSCSQNDPLFEGYYDVYEEIDCDTRKSIEIAYKEKYDKDIKWCLPDNDVNSFGSLNELNNYIDSNTGVRIYGKTGEKYILCEYIIESQFAAFYSVRYNNIYLLDSIPIFVTQFYRCYIYDVKEIYEVLDDLSEYDVDESDALNIEINNKKYNDKYFAKFMSEDDRDFDDAYSRIYYELLNKK